MRDRVEVEIYGRKKRVPVKYDKPVVYWDNWMWKWVCVNEVSCGIGATMETAYRSWQETFLTRLMREVLWGRRMG